MYARLPKIHADESRSRGLDRLELIRFLQVAQTLTVHHGALAFLLGINALRASEAAAVRIEDYAETLRGHRVLHLVGTGNKPATMPLTVPVLRVLEVCRGERTEGPLVLRPLSGNPIDRRDAYRMVARIAKAAGITRHISPHSLRHAAITNALDAGVPLRDADPRPARGSAYHRALRPCPREPGPPRCPLPHRLRCRCLNRTLCRAGCVLDPASVTPGVEVAVGAVVVVHSLDEGRRHGVVEHLEYEVDVVGFRRQPVWRFQHTLSSHGAPSRCDQSRQTQCAPHEEPQLLRPPTLEAHPRELHPGETTLHNHHQARSEQTDGRPRLECIEYGDRRVSRALSSSRLSPPGRPRPPTSCPWCPPRPAARP
jgi:hypothetical protein